MIKKLTAVSIMASFLLCACEHGQKEAKSTEIEKTIDTLKESSDKGNKNVQAINASNAGFREVGEVKVKITTPCFGVRNADDLDMLPRLDEVTRKDSSLIAKLNAGDVFILQRGEQGIKEIETETKALVSFQVGKLWIWKSAIK